MHKVDEKALEDACEQYDKEWLATELHSKATAAAIQAYLTAAKPNAEAVVELEWPPLVQVGRTISLFSSAIKSGEPWTQTCQSEYDKANVALQELFATLKYPTPRAPEAEALHDAFIDGHGMGMSDIGENGEACWQRSKTKRLAAAPQLYPPPHDTDVPCAYENAVAEAERAGKWEIDNSTPSPILTYEKCSVIQDDQAYYALRLIQADQAEEAERDVVTDEMVERGLKAAEDEAMRLTFLERDIRDGLTFDGSFTNSFKDRFRVIHRAALTAALGGSKP